MISERMGDLEDIIAYKQIEPAIPKELQELILNRLNLTQEEISNRWRGKEKEFEFLIILGYMGVFKSITAFEESVSKMFNSKTPDFFVELENEQQYLIEIKSTKNDVFKIAAKNLEERIEYAQRMGKPLKFAIHLLGMWMLFDASYLKSHKGKICLDDYSNSELDQILGTCSYIMPAGLKIRSVYSQKKDGGLDVYHEQYGNLVSYELFYQGRKIVRIKGTNSRNKCFGIILEALEDRLSSENQDVIRNGEYTEVLEYDDGKNINIIPEYMMILAPMLHTCDDEGKRQSIESIYMARKKGKKAPNFELGVYRGTIQELISMEVPIKILEGRKIYNSW